MVNGELIVDSFAGGGGASTGIEMALGVSPDIAINHDPEAIAMHAANHPHTRHYIEDVWKVDPLEVCGDLPVGLFWLSPDCTYHSKARGGKPFRDRREARGRRGLPWLAVYWAEKKRPRIIGMENVEEIEEWGPLSPDGSRDLAKAGWTFRLFVKRLQKLGYVVDWRVLHSKNYNVPTIRKRLVLIARCDGQPITWPEHTNGPGLLPYRACGDELDFSIPIPSIFEPGRDLCENTLRRIARGIDRYVVNDPRPFIVTSRGTSDAHIRASAGSIDDPLRTITAGRGNHHHLVAATLINTRNGERLGQAPRVRDLRDPFPTITAKGSQGALVTAFLARHYGGHENDGWNLRDPIPTITTTDHHSLVYAFMLKYYGTEQNPRLDEPLHTITTRDRFALVTIPVGEHAGVYYIADIGMRHLVPRELYNCQGFPRDYVIDPFTHKGDALKTGRRLPKKAQIRMVGNSVPPGLVAAVIRANFLESTVAEPRQVYA